MRNEEDCCSCAQRLNLKEKLRKASSNFQPKYIVYSKEKKH